MVLTFEVKPEENGRLLGPFLRGRGVSASLIKKVKHNPGGLCCAGEQIKTDCPVQAGLTIQLKLPEEDFGGVEPEDTPLEVVYEDDFAMVVDKPAGQVCHPTMGYFGGTLAGAFCGLMARRGMPAPFRAVNRLDKNTSGLVLLAKNAFSAPLLAAGSRKEYLAIIKGEPPAPTGSICAPIALSPGSMIRRCVPPQGQGGQAAQTDYQLVATGDGYSLVRAVTVTGRTHQIRVHFAHLGCPLAGDDLYGGDTTLLSRQALHCAEIIFTDPLTGSLARVRSPLAKDMQQLAFRLNIQYMETN